MSRYFLNTLYICFIFFYIFLYHMPFYNKGILLGIISKLYKIQGINTIKAITTGSKTVQQKDINWSKRILGKEALAHINWNQINNHLKIIYYLIYI